MEVRQVIHPDHAAMIDTDELREYFSIDDLFTRDASRIVNRVKKSVCTKNQFCRSTPDNHLIPNDYPFVYCQ